GWAFRYQHIFSIVVEVCTGGESKQLLAEMVAMRTVAMQNRVALDYLLAALGGTCAVIGAECCTYIPDETDGMFTMAIWHGGLTSKNMVFAS
uniref:Uncharacterized protein n=1 Tax=Esox lucius TaxID=8010 RepID=A0AAY5K183_ESOLU